MRLVGAGTLVAGEPGTPRACYTFPAVVALADGTLLATARHGATKDGDDDQVAVFVDRDDGRGFGPHRPLPPSPVLDGRSGTLKLAHLTQLASGALLAAAMWVDRTSYPGRPLFNPDTEGCLPMAILLSRSDDLGASWTDWRRVDLPDELGPPSLTSPLIQLADGSLAMSIETNKAYLDAGPWPQRAVLLRSVDEGLSWGAPVTSAQDPSGGVFNWDLRIAVAGEQLVSFAWTYDRAAAAYRNIHRRVSMNLGRTWTAPVDVGVTDQPGRPAILPDGRLVLPWVDRFGSRSVRARLAEAPDAPLDPGTDTIVYAHDPGVSPGVAGATLAGALTDMELWSFGLPFAAAVGPSEVMVVYYAGTAQRMDIHWARLAV